MSLGANPDIYYKFDEASPTGILVDSTSHTSGISGPSSALPDTGAPFNGGNCISLPDPGSGDFNGSFHIANTIMNAGTNPFSYTVRVKYASGPFVPLFVDEAGNAHQFHMNSNTGFSIDAGMGTAGSLGGSFSFGTGVWHNITLVRGDGNSHVKVYVDGSLISQTSDASPVAFNPGGIHIGGRGTTSSGIKGSASFQDLGFWNNYALTASEVAAINTMGLAAANAAPAPLTDLIAAVRGTPASMNFDATALSSAVVAAVPSESYYNDKSNWEQVEFVYRNGRQIKCFAFKNNGSDVFPAASSTWNSHAHAGTWVLSSITMTDWDGGNFTLNGAAVPSGFDITVS